MDYTQFIEGKLRFTTDAGFDLHEDYLNPKLFDFQKYIVRRASTDASHPNYIPISLWQKYASPVWYDIQQTETLNKEGRDSDDEKHIAPLQLQTIERAIHLWTNPGDILFTPFLGIGSEVYQALRMKRRGIGIELKKSYFEIAQRNCRNAIESTAQLTLDELKTVNA